MNLTTKQVKHIRYGTGTVLSHTDGRLTITFADVTGTKSFMYPEAFEQYLSIADPLLHEEILLDLKLKAEQTAKEKIRQEQCRLEEIQRLAEEKLALQKKSRRKPSQSKKKS
ncbi:hypothetical protein GCM10010912_16940 [Paenibacillus albidus]|uniref:Uncharacterized protein n=1 Tax=Paenibacillus albidus TaxID=2041023 RepID=A0A917C848_9BACL|nr:hypothetical protein [Paenibacillus albidus]GGF72426.1 hypothetical protein GCM10010912_16940 [Paenibacillus albidus]